MLVEEAMTRDPVTVTSRERLDAVEELMRAGRFRRVPVVDDGALTGIVSASDLAPHRGHLDETLVSAAWTTDPITIEPSVPLERAAWILLERKIGGLPVVHDGKVVGIVTTTDVLRTLLGATGATLEGTSRIDVVLEHDESDVSKIAEAVREAGGRVFSLGTNSVSEDDRRVCFVRFRADAPEAVAEALSEAGYRVQRFHAPD